MGHDDDKTKKFTLSVGENDILKYAKKIEKNAFEDKAFSQKINDYVCGKLKPNELLRIGTTPNSLKIVGV